MSSTSARSTAKKAPRQQRPIERVIHIECESTDEILTIIADNLMVEDLTIQACWNKITTPVILAIFRLKHIQSLNLWSNNIGDTEAEKIANHLGGSNLRSLDMRGNCIGAAGAEKIANHLDGSNLQSLHLGGNEIGDAGAEKIANNLVGSDLRSLSLGGNEISDAGAREIANNLVGSNLIYLYLYNNQIGPTEARQLLIDKWNELGNDPEKLIL